MTCITGTQRVRKEERKEGKGETERRGLLGTVVQVIACSRTFSQWGKQGLKFNSYSTWAGVGSTRRKSLLLTCTDVTNRLVMVLGGRMKRR